MLSPIPTRTTSPIFSFLSFLLFLLISTAAVVDARDCRTMIQRSLCGIGDNGATFCAPNTLNMCKDMGRYQVGDPVLKSAKCPCQYQVCMTFFFPFSFSFLLFGVSGVHGDAVLFLHTGYSGITLLPGYCWRRVYDQLALGYSLFSLMTCHYCCYQPNSPINRMERNG